MEFIIRGQKTDITEAIKAYIEKRIGKLEKYFNNKEIIANVLIKVRGIDQTVEVTIQVPGITLRGEQTHKDLYAAIDLVSEKIERQIRKNKTRIKNRNTKVNMPVFTTDFENDGYDNEKELIVKRKIVDSKPMDEEEAILQMNLIDHDFFIYKDVNTEKTSVVYKRKDGDYGKIEIN